MKLVLWMNSKCHLNYILLLIMYIYTYNYQSVVHMIHFTSIHTLIILNTQKDLGKGRVHSCVWCSEVSNCAVSDKLLVHRERARQDHVVWTPHQPNTPILSRVKLVSLTSKLFLYWIDIISVISSAWLKTRKKSL